MGFVVEPQELSIEDTNQIRGGLDCMVFCSVDEGCGSYSSCKGTQYYSCTGGNYLFPPKG